MLEQQDTNHSSLQCRLMAYSPHSSTVVTTVHCEQDRGHKECSRKFNTKHTHCYVLHMMNAGLVYYGTKPCYTYMQENYIQIYKRLVNFGREQNMENKKMAVKQLCRHHCCSHSTPISRDKSMFLMYEPCIQRSEYILHITNIIATDYYKLFIS